MYNRTGGPVGPFLLCSHTKTKGGEGRLKGRGVHTGKGREGLVLRLWDPVEHRQWGGLWLLLDHAHP